MKRLGIIVLGAWAACVSSATELPDVTDEALAELGSTFGVPQMSGFVFIDGRYLAPPYTVTRKGNGIFINRIQIEQPVPWARFAAPGAEAVPVAEPPKKAIDADGDFEEVKPVVAAEPAAVEAEPAAAAEPTMPKTVKSIDDLFDDDAPAQVAPTPAAAPVADPVAEAAAGAIAAPALTADELKRQKEMLTANLERLRKGYEQALARNEFFFFGLRHSRVNGNYGTARTLMGVLPKALRHAQSPQDLMQRINEGGVYFLDLGICSALFKNKSTFPLLEDRLAKIMESEELESLRRKTTTRW